MKRKFSCRVKDWRGIEDRVSLRFQPLPLRTAREVFPPAAHPVSFVGRVMGPNRLTTTFTQASLLRGAAAASSPPTAPVPRRDIHDSIAASQGSTSAAVSAA